MKRVDRRVVLQSDIELPRRLQGGIISLQVGVWSRGWVFAGFRCIDVLTRFIDDIDWYSTHRSHSGFNKEIVARTNQAAAEAWQSLSPEVKLEWSSHRSSIVPDGPENKERRPGRTLNNLIARTKAALEKQVSETPCAVAHPCPSSSTRPFTLCTIPHLALYTTYTTPYTIPYTTPHPIPSIPHHHTFCHTTPIPRYILYHTKC